MQILNLRREFEMQKMKETETIRDFSDRLLFIVNKVRLLGEDFPDKKVVENILVTLPERFESKISLLEESKDLSKISLVELLNALQAQEQRRTIRQEESMERLFKLKYMSRKVTKAKRRTTNIKESVAAIKELETFLPVNTVRKQITYRNIVGGDLILNAKNVINWDIWRRFAKAELTSKKVKLKLLINNRRRSCLWPLALLANMQVIAGL
jgi:hypothetical protein